MTPKERLLAAIRFRGPDRVPVCPRMWRYMLKHEGSQSIETYLKYAESVGLDPLLFVNAGSPMAIPPPFSHYENSGDVNVVEEIDNGNGFTLVNRAFETPAKTISERIRIPNPGGEFGIAPNNVIEEYLVKEPGDLDALRHVVSAFKKKPEEVPDFRKLSKEIGGQALVSLRTLSALSHNAGDVYGIEDMMISCIENQELVHDLIEVFHRPLMEITRTALEHGAEAVYCSTFYESISSGGSPSIYREFFLPRIRKHVELSHDYGAIYHLYDDGKVKETLPMMIDLGVDLISTLCPPPAGNVTLAEARSIAGDQACLNGGIDTVNTVWRGNPESIERAVREAIEQAATKDGGYILGTSDSITEETPEENFRAFFESAGGA